MAKREHPRYENTEWPDYEFREYPKLVYPGAPDQSKPYGANGKPLKGIQVNNPEEEREALGLDAPEGGEEADPKERRVSTSTRAGKTMQTSAKGVDRLRNEADEKEEMIAEAEALGVQIDKSWSPARIADAIETHKADAAAVA